MARDALRRLHRASKKPFEHFKDLVFAAGAHHGVSTFRALCGRTPRCAARSPASSVTSPRSPRRRSSPRTTDRTARGRRPAPTETPRTARSGVCGGHKVTLHDRRDAGHRDGSYQDEFVSQGTSRLKGATNLTVGLTDNDLSNYFYNGLFKNHMGSIRSEAALKIIVKALLAGAP